MDHLLYLLQPFLGSQIQFLRAGFHLHHHFLTLKTTPSPIKPQDAIPRNWPLSFQSDPSPHIRGTQPLGSSSNIYYHLSLPCAIHNLCNFPATQPPSASMSQLLKAAASLNTSSVAATRCILHATGTTQGKNEIYICAMVKSWILHDAANSNITSKNLPLNDGKCKCLSLLIQIMENTAHLQTRPTWEKVPHYMVCLWKANTPAISFLLAQAF